MANPSLVPQRTASRTLKGTTWIESRKRVVRACGYTIMCFDFGTVAMSSQNSATIINLIADTFIIIITVATITTPGPNHLESCISPSPLPPEPLTAISTLWHNALFRFYEPTPPIIAHNNQYHAQTSELRFPRPESCNHIRGHNLHRCSYHHHRLLIASFRFSSFCSLSAFGPVIFCDSFLSSFMRCLFALIVGSLSSAHPCVLTAGVYLFPTPFYQLWCI
jgi:hypothetical protein